MPGEWAECLWRAGPLASGQLADQHLTAGCGQSRPEQAKRLLPVPDHGYIYTRFRSSTARLDGPSMLMPRS
jgi:hypothetical protein